jgi:hypothetical protein
MYDYGAVYVDDLLIAEQDLSSITKALCDQHKFKLKRTGPLQYHLGCDYFKDNTGTLCFGPGSILTRSSTKACLDQSLRNTHLP